MTLWAKARRATYVVGEHDLLDLLGKSFRIEVLILLVQGVAVQSVYGVLLRSVSGYQSTESPAAQCGD